MQHHLHFILRRRKRKGNWLRPLRHLFGTDSAPKEESNPQPKAAPGTPEFNKPVRPRTRGSNVDKEGNVILRTRNTEIRHHEPPDINLPELLLAREDDTVSITLPDHPQLQLPPDLPLPVPKERPTTIELARLGNLVPWWRIMPWRAVATLVFVLTLVLYFGLRQTRSYLSEHWRPPESPTFAGTAHTAGRASVPITAFNPLSFKLDASETVQKQAILAKLQQVILEGNLTKIDAAFRENLYGDNTDSKLLCDAAQILTKSLRTQKVPAESILERVRPLHDRALKLAPDDANLMRQIGEFQIEMGKVDEGILSLENAAKIDPGNVPLKKRLAGVYVSRGEVDNAIRVLRNIVDILPTDIDARLLLASYLRDQGRPKEALTEYESLLRLDPANDEANRHRVDILFTVFGMKSEALDAARQAAFQRPMNPAITSQLAITALANGQWEESKNAFEQTIARVGTNGTKDPTFFAYYASALAKTNNNAEAITNYRKAIQFAGGDYPEAANDLAYLFVTQNENLPEARALIERAIAKSKPRPDMLDTYGVVLSKLGEHQLAIDTFNKALGLLATPNPDILEHLGDAQLAAGQKTEAAKAWRESLKARPNEALSKKLAALGSP